MRRHISSLIFLVFYGLLPGQQPSMIIEIHGKVAEVGSQSPVALLPLKIENYGNLATDNFGLFNVPVPYSSGIVKINVEHPGYEILNPPEGSKVLSKEIEPNSIVNIQIWVLGAERNEELIRQIDEAERLVAKLEKKNELSQLQIQNVNQRLLDTINSFELERKAYQSTLEELNAQIAQTEGENQALREELDVITTRLFELEKDNSNLLIQLTEALEARYLRQKSFHSEISNSLHTYLSRLKDFRDHLNRVEFVFKSRGAMAEFNRSLSNYNEIYETINGTQDDNKEAIEHYWQLIKLSKEYERIVEEILENIHKKEILALNDSVLLSIQRASVGKAQKPKKTKKAALNAIASINEKIDHLEPQINEFIKRLSDF